MSWRRIEDMATRFEPAQGLNETVAVMVAPEVGRIADRLRAAAADFAPDVKVWNTQGDDRVRPWHTGADAQAVPANLKFAVPQAPYRGNQHPNGVDMMWEPRDPEAGPLQVNYCRCFVTRNSDLADSIRTRGTQVQGARVTDQVFTDYDRAADSEFGDDELPGAFFMRRAIGAVAD